MHGYASAYEWGYAVNELASAHPGEAFWDENIPSWTSVHDSVPKWYKSIVPRMTPHGTTYLVGHSAGGLASRQAADSVAACGLFTVGTPHGGVNLVLIEDELVTTFQIAAAEAAYVAAMWLLPYTSTGETLAWEIIATVDGVIYLYYESRTWVANKINAYGPIARQSMAPGSTYLNSLPAAPANATALRVTVGPGKRGGPLALDTDLSTAEADEWGDFIEAAGYAVSVLAYYLSGEVDFEEPDWPLAVAAVVSATNLATLFINLEQHWCNAVSYPSSCVAHDGFVTVPSQTIPGLGVSSINLTGPAHTRQAEDPDVIDRISTALVALRP